MITASAAAGSRTARTRKDPVLRSVNALIAQIKRFAAPLPIAIELQPYFNRYTGDCQGVVLTDLFAVKPGNGVGTKVMTRLCALADRRGINIHTDAEGPRSCNFYRKFGFEDDRFSGHQLVHYRPLPTDDD